MIALREPSESLVRRYVRRHDDLPCSYAETGATRCAPPDGYRVFRGRTSLGSGAAVFNRAVEAAQRGAMFEVDWVRAFWPEGPLLPEQTVGIATRGRAFWSVLAWRVVYVLDELGPPRRFAFALGTLADHDIQGEQRFLIERRADDSVWYDLLSFTRPQSIWSRALPGLFINSQCRFVRDSARAMLRAADLELNV